MSGLTSMEHSWKDTDMGKPKYLQESVPEPFCAPKIPTGPAWD
jgi:hypothetical protein